MNIAKANSNDLEHILQLQKLCYTENAKRYNNYSIKPLTQSISDIESEFGASIFLKATIDGIIVGSVRASSNGNICHIGRLIVHPNHQNKGIGKSLMLNIEKQFTKVKMFELFTGNEDEKNLYLYKNLGYISFKENIADNVKLIYLQKQNTLN